MCDVKFARKSQSVDNENESVGKLGFDCNYKKAVRIINILTVTNIARFMTKFNYS